MSELDWIQYLKMHHLEKMGKIGKTGKAETFDGSCIPQVNILTTIIPSWVLTLKKPALRAKGEKRNNISMPLSV